MSTKAKKDERKFIVQLIKVYKSLPALWNKKSKVYNNRTKKNEAYQQLLCKYIEREPNAVKKDVVRKINSLRTNFRKELKRIKDAEKSGTTAQPKLWYFKEMKFLYDEEACSLQNTIQIEDDDDQESEVVGTVGGTSTINTVSVSNHFISYSYCITQVHIPTS
jgi:hypothetical protein